MRLASAVLVSFVLLGCRIEKAPSGRPAGPLAVVDSLAQIERDSASAARVEAAVRDYYQRLAAHDSARVREAFWPGATVAVRTAATGQARLSVLPAEEYVRQVMSGRDRLPPSGLRVVHAHVTTYEEFADAWVIWEDRPAGRRTAGPPARGLDAFHFARRDGRWRIVGVMAARETPGRPILAPEP
jgi:hypothetical protein